MDLYSEEVLHVYCVPLKCDVRTGITTPSPGFQLSNRTLVRSHASQFIPLFLRKVRCEIPRDKGVTSFEATLTLPRSVSRVTADLDAARKDFSHTSHFSDKDHVLHVRVSRLHGGIDFNIRVRCTLDRPYAPAFMNDLGPVNLSFAIP